MAAATSSIDQCIGCDKKADDSELFLIEWGHCRRLRTTFTSLEIKAPSQLAWKSCEGCINEIGLICRIVEKVSMKENFHTTALDLFGCARSTADTVKICCDCGKQLLKALRFFCHIEIGNI
ncbi:hypothetical protein HA402_011732 [Bradysia odoriphaga]|nr:hypothetical protein HA402_011732 [Bradysia odoriphaga]